MTTVRRGSAADEVQYLVLPDVSNPWLLARVRWPDVFQAISPARRDWQTDPGLFDLPYDPSSAAVTLDEAVGVSGRAMLAALAAGERDPEVLAELSKGRLRKKIPELRQALRGRFRDHHGMLIGLCLEHTAHLEAAIAKLDRQIDAVFAANERGRCPFRQGP